MSSVGAASFVTSSGVTPFGASSFASGLHSLTNCVQSFATFSNNCFWALLAWDLYSWSSLNLTRRETRVRVSFLRSLSASIITSNPTALQRSEKSSQVTSYAWCSASVIGLRTRRNVCSSFGIRPWWSLVALRFCTFTKASLNLVASESSACRCDVNVSSSSLTKSTNSMVLKVRFGSF